MVELRNEYKMFLENWTEIGSFKGLFAYGEITNT
jgi:hypothetical protein